MQIIDRRSPREGEPVKVSMNLNLHLLAIRSRRGDDRGRVIRHTGEDVALRNVRFFVSESGLKRVRERGCREVIAWALGDYVSPGSSNASEDSKTPGLFAAEAPAIGQARPDARAGFNPFEHEYFTTEGGRGVAEAEAAVFRIEHPQVLLYGPQFHD